MKENVAKLSTDDNITSSTNILKFIEKFEIQATAIPLALDDGPKVAKSIFSMLYFEYGWMEIKKQEKILITISYHFCM